MATLPIHFLAAMTGLNKNTQPTVAADVCINDAIQFWTGRWAYAHFSFDPKTRKVSWISFPLEDISTWTKELVVNSKKFYAENSDDTCNNENIFLGEFWYRNVYTPQNNRFYQHLQQDIIYDFFLRDFIEYFLRNDNKYVYQDNTYTGEQLSGKGMERRTQGRLINELADMFYVRLAKYHYDETGVKANREWLDTVMKSAIRERYPAELAEYTVSLVTLSDKANDLINNGTFWSSDWPNVAIVNAVESYIDMMV